MYCHIQYLRHGVEVHHGLGERLRVSPQIRHQSQHGSVEGAIDLFQRQGPRIVHVDDRDVAQEPEDTFHITSYHISPIAYIHHFISRDHSY